jgi:predicted flap endonuclease-1-like 5' DNA nuclease
VVFSLVVLGVQGQLGISSTLAVTHDASVDPREASRMAHTPDVRPVGDLPNAIGKTAARELDVNGISSLKEVAARSKDDLLAIHGVGPKAIAILEDALESRGLRFTEP